jgi:DNA-binding response OmpR family regulator
MHILVVDDEAGLRELLRRALQNVGYVVTTAGSGQEALDLFTATSFDMVLVDVKMPGMDGFTLCSELRRRSDVLIVLITAINQTDDIVYGYSIGADDYITKPFQLLDVTTRIQVLLRRAKYTLKDTTNCLITTATDEQAFIPVVPG